MSDPVPFPPALREFVESSRWTFAKTMPEWPHEYIVRDRVDPALFEALVRHIREHGFPGRFYDRVLTYFADGGLLYWTMGNPVEETTIVNRCREEGSYERRRQNGTLPEQKQASSRKCSRLIAFLTICTLLFTSAPPAAAFDWHPSILDRLTGKSVTSGTQTRAKVYFSPGGGCAEAVVEALAGAQKSVRVQAYSFTSAPIAKALVDAHRRGVSVIVILDKSNATGHYSSADFISRAGIPTFIDAAHAIAHNKIMVIDERQVITGSFNFTRAAEERNAENLLVIDDDVLAKQFTQNWEAHRQHSEPYVRRAKSRKITHILRARFCS